MFVRSCFGSLSRFCRTATKVEKVQIQLPDVRVVIKTRFIWQFGPMGLSRQHMWKRGRKEGWRKRERKREHRWKIWQNVPAYRWRVARAYLSDDWGRLIWVSAAVSRHKTHGKHNIILDHYSPWTYVCTVIRIDFTWGTECVSDRYTYATALMRNDL